MYALCVVSLDCRTCKVTTCCCTVTSLSGAISIVTRSAACVCHLSGASRQLLTGSPSSHLKLIHKFRPASPPGADMQLQRGSPFKPKPHDTRVPPGSDALALTHQQKASGKCSNAEDETTSIFGHSVWHSTAWWSMTYRHLFFMRERTSPAVMTACRCRVVMASVSILLLLV